MLKFNLFRKLSTVFAFLLIMIISFSCQEEEAVVVKPEAESARFENCLDACDAQLRACSSANGDDTQCWTAWNSCFDKCWAN